MQAYLLSGLASPTSSFNLFLPLPRPRVSNHYHSSVYYHYHNNQSKLTLLHHHHLPRPAPGWGRNGGVFASSSSSSAAAGANRDHQNHYAVLGISTTASSTEIKRTYRLLAKKYHPDVCKESKSGEVFKSIRYAYDVLSNEVTRAQYDFKLRLQKKETKEKKTGFQADPSPVKSDTSEEKHSVSFSDVLKFALVTLIFMCYIVYVLGFRKRGGSLVTPIIVVMWVVTNLVKVCFEFDSTRSTYEGWDNSCEYHPDVWKDSKSGEVFMSIGHAYDVLSNEVTRAQYDFKVKSIGNMRPKKRVES